MIDCLVKEALMKKAEENGLSIDKVCSFSYSKVDIMLEFLKKFLTEDSVKKLDNIDICVKRDNDFSFENEDGPFGVYFQTKKSKMYLSLNFFTTANDQEHQIDFSLFENDIEEPELVVILETKVKTIDLNIIAGGMPLSFTKKSTLDIKEFHDSRIFIFFIMILLKLVYDEVLLIIEKTKDENKIDQVEEELDFREIAVKAYKKTFTNNRQIYKK